MALYHSYRPQSFEDVLGQPHIVSVLKSALAHDRVGHAYLFSGPRGVGKTSIARILAKAINCEKRTVGDGKAAEHIPCNTCSRCVAITNGSAMDVIEIDAASNRGIDEIRELRDRVRFAPTELTKKVYIIDEVHMLTKEAFNALLKTLEEPPEHAVFVLATTELAKIPETIFSRCQHFQFRRAALEALGKHLEAIAKDEGRTIEPDALELLVMRAEGSYRDALSAFEQVLVADDTTAITANRVRELFGLPAEETALEALAAISVGDRARILSLLEMLAADGVSLESFLGELIRIVRLLLFVATLGVERFSGGSTAFKTAAPALLDAFNEADLVVLLERFALALAEMRTSPLPTLPVELALLSEAGKRATDTPTARPVQTPKAVSVPAAPKKEKPTEVVLPPAEPELQTPPPTVENEPTVDQSSDKPSSDTNTESSEIASFDGMSDEKWHEARKRLMKEDASLTMILGDLLSVPRVDDTRVILEVPYKFHADRLMSSKPKSLITSVLREVIGKDVSFECVVSAKSKVASPSSKSEPVVEDVLGALSEL